MIVDGRVGDERVARLEAALGALVAAVGEVVGAELGASIADEAIADALAAAARLYSAKTDRVGRFPWPMGRDQLNATETVRLVTALLDAADINLFDMALWYRRTE